jgi:branched-chain amino acid transport system ATP-binding protein
MNTVFTLADRMTVLVEGQVIATADPDAIRSNPRVRQAYLGEELNSIPGKPHSENSITESPSAC